MKGVEQKRRVHFRGVRGASENEESESETKAHLGNRPLAAGQWGRSSESHGAAKSGARHASLEGLERNYGAGVGDSWDDLDLMADEMADIDI